MAELRGEEKWRLDRTGVPEGWLRRGRGSHAWRDSQGFGSGKVAFLLPNRLGNSAWLSGRVLCRKEQRALAPPTQVQGDCLAPRLVPCTPKAPPGHMGPGGIGGRPGRSGEAGRRVPPRLEEQKREGHLFCPLEPRKLAGLLGGVPHPLRPEAGGPFCSVKPKPHLPYTPPTFPALWVLSIGPAHCPNLTPA